MEDIDDWQSKLQPCTYSNRLLDKILSKNETAEHQVDIIEVKKAIFYAKKYHGDQLRKSG